MEMDARLDGRRFHRYPEDMHSYVDFTSDTSGPSSPSFVLAFDFGGTKMAIATASLKGDILMRCDLSTSECRTGDVALARAISAGKMLVENTCRQTNGRLIGVGVSTMGITREDRVDMAPNVPGWSGLRIPSAMRETFPGVPILIENDVKAAALAELRSGALRGTSSGLYVNLGTGIAVALTLRDQVVRGAHGAAGEIAYNLRHVREKRGARDEVAPFEEFAGGRAIGERASRRFGQQMTAADVFAMAHVNGDARAFIEETILEISFQLTNIVIAWDPEKVVFGGGLTGAADDILPVVEDAFARFVPFPPEVALAHYRRDSGLHGAIELALEYVTQIMVHE